MVSGDNTINDTQPILQWFLRSRF